MMKYEQSFPVFLVMFIIFLVVFLFITVSNTCCSKPEVIDAAETTSEFTCTVEEVCTPAYYIVTEEERYLLAKLVHSEASICSEECQRAVVSVVFNRLESGKWKKT